MNKQVQAQTKTHPTLERVFPTMSLRRFAQENNAGFIRQSPIAKLPSTLRNRSSIGAHSTPPALTPWRTAGTPQNKARKEPAFPNGTGTPTRRAVIRKKSLLER